MLAKRDRACQRCTGETRCDGGEATHDLTAMGSSQDPGTDSTTMLLSLTPQASSLSLVPLSKGSMMVAFQRAWTMPMRRALPSCCCGVGPLRECAIAIRVGDGGG